MLRFNIGSIGAPMKKLVLAVLIFLLPLSAFADTWFSCNGDTFCGASTVSYWGTVDLASGQSSPVGATNVWRFIHPAGMPPGEGIGNVWLPDPPGGTQEMGLQGD